MTSELLIRKRSVVSQDEEGPGRVCKQPFVDSVNCIKGEKLRQTHPLVQGYVVLDKFVRLLRVRDKPCALKDEKLD